MGTRKEGILQVDDVGGAGSTPVDITAPLGPNVSADSISVTLATDEDAIEVTSEFPEISGSFTALGQTSTPILISGAVGFQTSGISASLFIVPEISVDQITWRESPYRYAVADVNTGFTYGSFLAIDGFLYEGIVTAGCYFRLRCTGYGSGIANYTIRGGHNRNIGISILDEDGMLSVKTAQSTPALGALGLIVRQSGMPFEQSLADNTTNPTLTKIQTFPSWFDGATWDRARGDSTNGLLVNLGANNDVTMLGAATEIKQDNLILTVDAGNTSLASINAKLPTLDTGRIPVILPAGGSGLTDTELRATPVPVDTELPAAAAITDDTANPTTTKIQTFPMFWDVNNSLWQRWTGNLITQETKEIRSSTTVTTSVPDSATSVTILAGNSVRLGATVLNTSTATLRLRLSASAATLTNYTVALVSGAYYEIPFGYTSAITGIWDTDPGTGSALVTELTA